MATRALTLCVLALACASPPQPLAYPDLALDGLVFEADTAIAIRHFGVPDSIRTLPHPFPIAADGSLTVPVLHFRGLTLLFGGDGLLSGFEITAPQHATGRGLRVGADSSTAERLYGAPRTRDAQVWIFSSEDGLVDMVLLFHSGRISRITLGTADFAPAR